MASWDDRHGQGRWNPTGSSTWPGPPPHYYSRLSPVTSDPWPSLALVTPALGSAETIADAVESVLEDRYPALDYLVADGGSRDGTAEIARRYEPRVRVLSEADRGQSDAINKGIRLTQGDIVGWLNADDLLLPGTLRRVGALFREYPDVVAFYGDSILVDREGRELERSGVQPFDRWRLIHSRNYIEQQSCFFRRDAFEAVGGLAEGLDFVMDWDLWIKLSRWGDLIHVPEVWSARRLTAGNKTQSGGLARLTELWRMLRQHGATGSSPVMLNYAIEAGLTELRWRRGGEALAETEATPGPKYDSRPAWRQAPARLLAPARRWYRRRMVEDCWGSYPGGDLPPVGRLVVPMEPGRRHLRLQLRPMPIPGVARYSVHVRCDAWRGPVWLSPGRERGQALDLKVRSGRGFYALEFRASHSMLVDTPWRAEPVPVAANVTWRWA